GKPDLLSANLSGNSVSLLLGNGGTFFAPLTTLSGGQPTALALGDFNGDGQVDVASADFGSNTLSVLLNSANHNATGSFQNAANFNTGAGPFSVAIGDLNGDGKPDLALANADSGSVSVLLGNGNGSFQNAANFNTGGRPVSVALGDVNGDGKPD